MTFRNARAQRAGNRTIRIRLERHRVERRQPNANLQPRRFDANALDDLTHEARAVFQAAAIGAGPVDRAEKFVAKIAVTMFDVDEIVAAGLGALGGDNIVVDQRLDFVVGDHRPVRRIAEFAVEQRMVIGDDRFELGVVVRLAETAGMRELQSDDDVVLAAGRFLVRGDCDVAQTGDVALALRGHRELFWIGAAIKAHRAGFAAPDQFGAA